MPKDPLGFIARMNAFSLMLITPEFYKIRRLRNKDVDSLWWYDFLSFYLNSKWIQY